MKGSLKIIFFSMLMVLIFLSGCFLDEESDSKDISGVWYVKKQVNTYYSIDTDYPAKMIVTGTYYYDYEEYFKFDNGSFRSYYKISNTQDSGSYQNGITYDTSNDQTYTYVPDAPGTTKNIMDLSSWGEYDMRFESDGTIDMHGEGYDYYILEASDETAIAGAVAE